MPMLYSEYILHQAAACIRQNPTDLAGGGAKGGLLAWGGHLPLIAVVLSLIVAGLSWAAGGSAAKREGWLVVAAFVADLPGAVKRELCTDGLVNYFRHRPEFAPEWFRAVCTPLIIDAGRGPAWPNSWR
jgi:hypothetical protein